MQQTQEVADVDSPAGQEQSREEKRASAQKMASPSKRLIAFTTLMSNVLQIAPIAVVQFADFLTDVFVVLQFWELGDRTSATIGFGCMVLSILPVILGERRSAVTSPSARSMRCAGLRMVHLPRRELCGARFRADPLTYRVV